MLRAVPLLLLAACGPPADCRVVPTEPERACEAADDCALAYVDCGRQCSCSPVHRDAVAGVEARSGADCGTTACASSDCDRDCKGRFAPVCLRGRCAAWPVGEDSGYSQPGQE